MKQLEAILGSRDSVEVHLQYLRDLISCSDEITTVAQKLMFQLLEHTREFSPPAGADADGQWQHLDLVLPPSAKNLLEYQIYQRFPRLSLRRVRMLAHLMMNAGNPIELDELLQLCGSESASVNFVRIYINCWRRDLAIKGIKNAIETRLTGYVFQQSALMQVMNLPVLS